ncbi:hypothetical protein [Erythrobacter sp. WG]|uniref:hypothetical protein n=1 Tax=Erythrobacter sp. WG TaxID=2985510 RepID=UPI00226F5136|nr:hypothetical protein [Erythrobacter sp. WG]MCX9147091.1 hypothetical protein [Erythrobacter sp. WG]
MTLPPARPALRRCLAAAALLAAVPLAAQESPGSFTLPPPSPTPTPPPAGPEDERAGVTIPPRPIPTATPTPRPATAPSPLPTLAPEPVPTIAQPAPVRSAPTAAPSPTTSLPGPVATGSSSAATATAAPQPAVDGNQDTVFPPPAPPTLPGTSPQALPDFAAPAETADAPATLPEWWPLAAAGLGGLALLGGGALLWRRRRPRVLRLAAPSAIDPAGAEAQPDLTRLDLALEITGATRSLMRFTIGYRLTVANRSGRAVQDLKIAVQLACARAAGGSGPSAGAAQGLSDIARVGPHQAQGVTGEIQLPLSAIAPLRQGSTPLFIPLVHVTIEGAGQPALTRTFVVGPRSASGRVHPITLDQPPGSIAGLVAQPVAPPPASAAA